ncbi:MAG: VanZ family protein [Peptostreptococcaceae bacterium]
MKNENKNKQVLYVIFITYLLIVFKIVLFKYDSLSTIVSGDIRSTFRSYNLIPFKTIVDFFSIGIRNNNLLWAFSNILGNILIFMPLGYLMPMLFNKFEKIKNIIIVAVSLSIFFEVTQYIVYLGSLDIDDLILNTLGGISGYLVYAWLKRLISNNRMLNHLTMALSVICFVLAFTIAKEQFGNLLGLTTNEVITIGEEKLPKREADARGTYIDMKDNIINIYKGVIAQNSSDIEFLEKQSIKINERTKFYITETEELEKESTIKYKEISKDEFLKCEAYSLLKIWYDENNKDYVQVIEVSKKLDTSSQIMSVESNDKKEIQGYVKEINPKGMLINLITVQELKGGSSISVVGRGENENLVNVEIEDNSKLVLKLIKSTGELIESKECTKDEIDIEDTVRLKGFKKGNTFIAKDIEINKIVD